METMDQPVTLWDQWLKKLIVMPFEEYLENKDGRLSSHALSDFRDSARLFKRKEYGLAKDKDTQALIQGHAYHTLILEGSEVYEDRYLFGGPINPRTKKPYDRDTNKFREWAETQSGTPISDTEHELNLILDGSVHNHAIASQILSEGVVERTIKVEVDGIHCQGRMDHLSETFGITDLKGCRDLNWFRYDCKKFGYVHQKAFYRMLFRELTGKTEQCHLVVCEKEEPYSTAVFLIDSYELDKAEEGNRKAMVNLKECRESDVWPTGWEDLQHIGGESNRAEAVTVLTGHEDVVNSFIEKEGL